MATEGGGKIRAKRSHGGNKPYVRRQSLLGRVTDKVKGLFSPSWIVDMVVKKDSPQITEGDSEEMDEDNVPQPQPSTSKATAGEPTNANTEAARPKPTMPTHVEERTTAPTIQTQKRMDVPFSSYNTLERKDITNGNEEPRPSVGQFYSAPQQDRQQEKIRLKKSQEPVITARKGLLGNNNNTSMRSDGEPLSGANNSFLWSEKKAPRSRPQTPVDSPSKPSFNISAFNSSLLGENSSLLGGSFHESSYYPGKTTFGGASSHRKNRLRSSSPYQTVTPVRRQVKAKPLNNSTGGVGVTSSTAKRILDALEKMSTPLSDAKKIPASGTAGLSDSPLSFSPASYRKRSRPLHASSGGSRTPAEVSPARGPPLNRLSTPRNVSISRNLGLPSRSAMPSVALDGSGTAQQRRQPSPVPRAPPAEPPMKSGGKMRREKSGHHYSSRQDDDEEEEVVMPKLSTNFKLPVTQMPSFSFGQVPKISPSKSSGMGTSRSGSTQSTAATTGFTFSSPIQKTPESMDTQPSSPGSAPAFQFSTPLQVADTPAMSTSTMPLPSTLGTGMKSPSISTAPKAKSPSLVPTMMPPAADKDTAGSGPGPAKELKKGSVMDILGKPPGPLSPANQLKQGSVMDILGKGKPSSTGSLADQFKPAAGSWECPTCMINNKADVSKCAACATAKPSSKPSANTAAPLLPLSASGFGDKFKPAAGSWECPTCMINNKASDQKCVACATAQPGGGSKSAGSSSVQPPLLGIKDTLSSQFKAPSGSWECDVCMVNNKAEAAKCAACETPNPKGPPQGGKAEAPKGGSGFGDLFKPVAGSWECDTCMVQNDGSATKCVACETPKPGSQASGSSLSSSFQFGSKGGFTFGSSSKGSTATSSSSSGFTFGGPIKDTDKKLVAPATGGFEFGKTSTSKDSKAPEGGFQFGAPLKPDSAVKAGEDSNSKGFVFGQSKTDSKTDKSISSITKPDEGKASSISGITTASTSVTSALASTGKKEDKPAIGGFSFGSTSDQIKPASETKPALGGFSFGASKIATSTQASDTKSAVGGFSFGSTKTDAAKDSTKDSSAGGFSFAPAATAQTTPSTQPEGLGGFNFKPAASTAPVATSQPPATTTENKPAGGMFSFSAAGSTSQPASSGTFSFSAGSATAAPPAKAAAPSTGFSFGAAAKPAAETGGFGFKTSAPPAQAEKPEDDGPGGKKAAFGTSSKPTGAFQFSAGSSASSTAAAPSGAAFTFSAGTTSIAPTATTASTAGTAAGVFSFGQSTPAASTVQPFGTAASTTAAATTTTTPAATGFGFAPLQSSTQLFGTATTSTTTTAPAFGTTTHSFGSATGSAFGAPGSTPAFGGAASTTAFGTSTAFGAPTTTTTPSSTPVFGSTPVATTTPSSTPVFGAPVSTTPSSTPVFGASTPSGKSTPVFGTTTTAPAISAFGAGATPAFGQAAASTPVFGAGTAPFGTPNTAASTFGTSSAPAFGTPGTTTQAFGGTATQGFGQAAAAAPVTGFGQAPAQATPAAAGFNFSGAPANSFAFGQGNAASTGPVFQFGKRPSESQGGSQPPPQPAGGYNFSAAAAPQTGFNFSAAAPPQQSFNFSAGPPQQPSFQFNATPKADSNPFSMAGTPSSTGGQRRIKKAVRKIRK